MKWHHKILFLTFSFIVIGLIAGVWKEKNKAASETPTLIAGTFLRESQNFPSFNLLDMYHQPFSELNFIGNWNIVFFGYTQCPDICPHTLHLLANLKKRPDLQWLNLIFISINPERDSPEQLKKFLEQPTFSHAKIHGLTGNKSLIHALASEIGLFIEQQTNEQQPIGHSGTVLVINPKGEIQALLTHIQDELILAHDLKRIMRFKKT
ncbi:MAG TPA: SCO family protein [Gammaproteobacteria bacterium]|nr:SCO family protein [Gammaproteobacteria bacterium]